MRYPKEPVVWRTSPGAKVLVYAAVVVCAPAAVALGVGAASEGDVATAAWCIGLTLAVAATAIVYVHRVRVICSRDELVVVSLLRRRRLNWGAVASADSGFSGVAIHLKDGRQITASAVQKANASVWLGRRTRSDDLVDYINGRVARRH